MRSKDADLILDNVAVLVFFRETFANLAVEEQVALEDQMATEKEGVKRHHE